MKILIIEDESMMRNSLAEKFANEGFDVSIGIDGEDGLKKALQVHPDIILLDILMPKMDGLMMLKKLRQDSWGAHVKVIILSNVSDVEKIAEAMTMGWGGQFTYLVKTDHTLESVVKEVKKQLNKNN
jgi:two-component system response regulator MprA